MIRRKNKWNWMLAFRRSSSASCMTLAAVGVLVCGFDGCRRKAPKQDLSDVNRPRPPVVSEPLTNVVLKTNLIDGTNALPFEGNLSR